MNIEQALINSIVTRLRGLDKTQLARVETFVIRLLTEPITAPPLQTPPIKRELTDNEKAQLLQTVEMFEVITASQPDDYQSLELLHEAYRKLGDLPHQFATRWKIARAYVRLGQASSAVLEYEDLIEYFSESVEAYQIETVILEYNALLKQFRDNLEARSRPFSHNKKTRAIVSVP